MRDFLDGLDNDDLGATEQLAKRDLHVVNGGTSLVNCIKCNGSGMTRWGSCFRCQGKGQITARSAAASKAKVTAAANKLERSREFWATHEAEMKFLSENSTWSDFFRSLLEKFHEFGSLTDNQLAAVRSSMAKMAAKRAEKAAERLQAAPVCDASKIETIFRNARAAGLKKVAFRAAGLKITPASANGRNAGTLWVATTDGELQGGITNGKFIKRFGCQETTEAAVMKIAEDPMAAAKFFGRNTGSCSCCGRELTDPASIEAGIGPVCATKWGL